MKLVRNTSLFLFLFFVFQKAECSQTVNIQKAQKIAHRFILQQNKQDYSVENSTTLFDKEQKMPKAYLFSLKPQGYVIVSSMIERVPILAYSFEFNFVQRNSFEKEISLSLIREIVSNDQYRASHTEREKKSNASKIIYGPYVYTMWGQVNCYDVNGHLINVNNIFTPNHYAPGCVAVSQATIMDHYHWPPKGVGTTSYYDGKGSSRGNYSVNCGQTEYQWNIALERYRGKASTIEQREAAGEVTYQAAVSLQMNFESNGSTSNVNRIPGALASHFRFTALYRSRSSTTFWSLLDSNMVYKKPAVLAVENSSGGGHSVVCDGLKIEDDGTYYYHLNMGWWGVSNGWYKIRGSFDAGGYNSIIGAAMNIIPEPMIEPPVISSDSVQFNLKWSYPAKAEAEAFEVQKSIDNGSWITLTDELTDTSLRLIADPEKSYKFRVRAKTNGKWYQNSWSTTETLHYAYTSIKENRANLLKCYPNPFQTELSVQLKKELSFPVEITVYNLSGREIYRSYVAYAKTQLVLKTDSWRKGFYVLKLVSGSQVYFVKAIKK